MSNNTSASIDNESEPSILKGWEYIILRREIRRAQNQCQNKDLDILAYLHPIEQRDVVERFASHNNLEAFVVNGFTSDFPQLLARSRFFLSSFGYSFYEALALEAFPVVWPLSESHHNDCLVFYRRMGLLPIVIGKEEELETTLLSLLAGSEPECLAVEDGASSIIREIAGFLRTAS